MYNEYIYTNFEIYNTYKGKYNKPNPSITKKFQISKTHLFQTHIFFNFITKLKAHNDPFSNT